MDILVVGSGQMGAGIAQTAATAGHTVRLHDRSEDIVQSALAQIRSRLARAVEKGTLTSDRAEQAGAALHAAGDDFGAYPVDVVIEAITEEEAVKFALFARLDAALPAHTILASNTSSISLTALAACTRRADRVIGMHFMNPVPLMQLVEIVRGLGTSDAVHATIVELAQSMGKVPVTVADAPGFVSNRILMPMINEAICTLAEGIADVEGIDTVMRLGMNHPLGPLALADLIGLDTCLAIMQVLQDGFGDTKYRASVLLKRYVAAGRLGKKSGRGFYRYGAAGERLEASDLGA